MKGGKWSPKTDSRGVSHATTNGRELEKEIQSNNEDIHTSHRMIIMKKEANEWKLE